MNSIRGWARSVVPFAVRLECRRLARGPEWVVETPTIAKVRAKPRERARYPHLLARHRSPLLRDPALAGTGLQRGKEHNVALASGLLDGLIVPPNRIFSYHRTVGRPSRFRGFRDGLELHAGKPSRGVGGGCCQVSNMLFLLALRGGMKVVERHRHGLDLFPDHERTIPFGCGATVYYNFADLRFENPLPFPVMLALGIRDGFLVGEIRSESAPEWTVEVYEMDHRFSRDGDAWIRENRIRRRFRGADGEILLDQEVACNRGRVLYDPGEDQTCGAPS
ncbi:MAG: VanW family protein [Planctomycetes bacterium]|nr:VanW family protein [Planctomycetota bacterium]